MAAGDTHPTPDVVRDALRAVIDPELGDNIVDLGMVQKVEVSSDGTVALTVALTVAGCPLRAQIERDVRGRLLGLRGIEAVDLTIGEMNAEEKSAVMARARWKAREDAPRTEIPANARILAVASGKGGVGKSSVTVNLAVALARSGHRVGVLDADIWGFSVPRLLGMDGDVEARQGKMVPLERRIGDGLLRVLSMGFLADEDRAIMWRGLVLNRAVQQFLQDAHWGDLDYLLIDLPPGTGDVQMGLARMLPRTELLLVTTPPLAASRVAARAADMARRGYLRVAGVIENMGDFTCEHGTTYSMFGSGGGKRLADELGVPLLGSIPLHPSLSRGGDEGRPVANVDLLAPLTPLAPLAPLAEPNGGPDGEPDGHPGIDADERRIAQVFADIARLITEEVAPIIETTGCTARLLDHLERVTASATPATPPAAAPPAAAAVPAAVPAAAAAHP